MNPTLERRIWPAAILGVALVLRLLLFTGVQGNDDRLYSASAFLMSRGEPSASPDLFRTRVAYVAPVALLYKVFGVHIAGLIAPCLLASLALVALAHRLGHVLYGPVVGRVAGFFVAICPLEVFYATMGGTDPLLAAWIGLGVWLLVDPGSAGSPGRRIGCAVLAGLAWGGAHLTKESGLILLLPVAPFLLARVPRKSLVISGLVVAAVLGLEVLVYGVSRGDPLFRVHVARLAVQDSADPFPGFGTRLVLFPSICLNPFDGMFPYTGGLMALAAAGIAWAYGRDRRRSGSLATWWLATGLFFCLFPATLVPYKAALPLQPRMLAALTLPGALLAAVALVEVAGAAVPRRAWIAGAAASLLSLTCAVRVHQDGVFWRSGLEWAQARIGEHPGTTIVTDPRTAESLAMMFAYAPPSPIRGFGPTDPPPADGTLLLELPAIAASSRDRDGVQPPSWWTTLPRKPIAEEEVPGRRRLRGGRLPGEKRVLSWVGP